MGEGQRIGGSKRRTERNLLSKTSATSLVRSIYFESTSGKVWSFSQPASQPARLPTGNTERVEVSTKKGVGESFVPSSGRVDAPVKSIGRPEVETKAADFHADSTTDLHAFLSLIPLLMSLSRKLSSRPSRWQDFAGFRAKAKAKASQVKNYIEPVNRSGNLFRPWCNNFRK